MDEDYADCENWCECGLPRTVCDGEHDDDPAKELDYCVCCDRDGDLGERE